MSCRLLVRKRSHRRISCGLAELVFVQGIGSEQQHVCKHDHSARWRVRSVSAACSQIMNPTGRFASVRLLNAVAFVVAAVLVAWCGAYLDTFVLPMDEVSARALGSPHFA